MAEMYAYTLTLTNEGATLRRCWGKKQNFSATIGSLALTSGKGLVDDATEKASRGKRVGEFSVPEKAFYPLACYFLAAKNMKSSDGLCQGAELLRHADPVEAGWWFALMTNDYHGARAIRAFRILLRFVP